MGIVKYKATTPARRYLTSLDFNELTRTEPHRPLTEKKTRKGGRNQQGRITSRWRGGGHKKRYRKIDFVRREKMGVPGQIESIEYDPNRSARIALVKYADGDRRYILAPVGVAVGDDIAVGEGAEIRAGNTLPLEKIPLGTLIHNIELKVGRGGQIVRSAGSSAQLLAREPEYAQVRLPSGEVRRVLLKCLATIGQVSNPDHENITIGKAGRSRWLGRNPRVRGAAMNPVDHPHGGGEGRTKGGRHPVSPTGVPTKGYKTRTNKRTTKFIVQKRKRRKK